MTYLELNAVLVVGLLAACYVLVDGFHLRPSALSKRIAFGTRLSSKFRIKPPGDQLHPDPLGPYQTFDPPDISEFLADLAEEFGPGGPPPVLDSDFYSEDMLDDVVIAKLKEERKLDNDRWQSCQFRDIHSGDWSGFYELFYPTWDDNQGLAMERLAYGDCRSIATPANWPPHGVNITITETFQQRSPTSVPLPLHRLALSDWVTSLMPSDFRTASGIQTVGNAFTINKLSSDGTAFVAELGIRDGGIRTRVRYAYTTHTRANTLTKLEIQSAAYDLSLVAVVVIREALANNATEADLVRLRSREPGQGIYDPQIAGEPYVTVTLPGRLSLQFPRGIALHKGAGSSIDALADSLGVEVSREPSILTAEIVTDTMRYQVDRRAISAGKGDPLGPPPDLRTIQSLELTEIRLDDAVKYTPMLPST